MAFVIEMARVIRGVDVEVRGAWQAEPRALSARVCRQPFLARRLLDLMTRLQKFSRRA
jgi:hypothetical protein